MEKVATRMGKPYSFANVRRMFLEADLNGDGYIDYDEWMTVQKEQKARKLAAARATLPVAGCAARRASRSTIYSSS